MTHNETFESHRTSQNETHRRQWNTNRIKTGIIARYVDYYATYRRCSNYPANPSLTPRAFISNFPIRSSTFELTSSIHPKLPNCSFKTLTTSPNKTPPLPLPAPAPPLAAPL